MSSADHERDDGGRDMLAAEYVVGVLDPQARAMAEARLRTDPDFADEVALWQGYFASLDDAYTPVTPPAGVLERVEARLFGDARGETPSRGALSRLWGSLALWRTAALGAVLFALAVLLAPLIGERAPGPELVASLQAEDSPVRFLAVYDRAHSSLRFNHVSGERQSAHDFELWVIEGDAAPVSLGVIPAGQAITIAVAPGHRGMLHSGAVLAITSEPLGGSASGAPTGPVVAAGDIRAL